MPKPTIRDPFVWHELMTTDTKAALDFYGRVVGWKAKAMPQQPDYTLLAAKTGAVAGVMVLPEDAKSMGAPPSWLIYIGTPDVDQTTRRAQELGGRVLKEPADIPEVGRFAVLQDPQGATFAVFTPQDATMGAPPSPGVGGFSWHELTTTDWQAAFDFYSRLFGFVKTEAMDMGPEMGTYQMYGVDRRTLGGMWNKPPSMQAPPNWMAYISVPDSKKAAETVKKLGGQILHGPMEVPGGDWVAQCQDPQGVVFAVHSKKPAGEAAPAAKPAAKKAPARKPAARKAAAKKRPATKVAAKKRPAKKAARKVARKKVARRKAAPRAKKRVARRPVRRAKRAVARRRTARPARRKTGARKRH